MKKCYTLFTYLTILFMSLGLSGTVNAQNLLTNGDMEVWEADTLAEWDIHQAEIEVAQETGIVNEGSSSAKVTVNGDRGGTDLGQTGIIVEDGVTYDFSCQVYNTDTTVFFAWVIGSGPGDFTFSTSGGVHSNPNIVDEWTEFTWEWTNENAQYDTVYVFYRFYKREKGSEIPAIVYIDDAVVEVKTVSDDASLSDLTIEGGTVAGFDPDVTHYEVDLPADITEVPTVDAVVNDPNASYIVTPAANLTGDEAERTTTLVVTAEDGTTTAAYTITFNVTTGIYNANAKAFNVYPNPARDQITIEGLKANVTEVRLLDITGKVIKTITVTGDRMLVDLSDLNPGYYFIKAGNSANRLVKQ